MNARHLTWPIVIALVFAGMAGVVLRQQVRPLGAVQRGETFWRIGYHLRFTAKSAKATLEIAFPSDTSRSRVSHLEYDFPRITAERRRSTRSLHLQAVEVGSYDITPKCDIRLSPRAAWSAGPAERLSPDTRAALLQSRRGVEVDDPAVLAALEKLQAAPAGQTEMVDRIFEYCSAEIAPGGRTAPQYAATAIKQSVGSVLGRARAFVALCRAAKIPARLVVGLQIKQSPDIKPHTWAEAMVDARWEPFDPENGFARELPHNYVAVRTDSAAIVHTEEVADLQVTYSATLIHPEESQRGGRRFSDVMDLTRLPTEMRETFEVILLMPLGALVTALFRTVIGLRTFGTFTPTLIALAFVFNDWTTGVAVFAVVMVVGLGARRLLDYLKLLLVPRLSVILTIVALNMVFCVSVFDYYSYTPSAQAVLLPMVILTMTVERYFLVSEEDSPRFALQLLVSTLVVAACCYGVLRWQSLGSNLIQYPEVHLITIAIFILLGRYTGYRLNELLRFRDLVATPPTETRE